MLPTKMSHWEKVRTLLSWKIIWIVRTSAKSPIMLLKGTIELYVYHIYISLVFVLDLNVVYCCCTRRYHFTHNLKHVNDSVRIIMLTINLKSGMKVKILLYIRRLTHFNSCIWNDDVYAKKDYSYNELPSVN